jgi:hypothetical protein
MTAHRITVTPEHRGEGRYTYNYRCSCNAWGYGFRSRGAAEYAGRQHQQKEARNG